MRGAGAELHALGPTMARDINAGPRLHFRSLLQLVLFSSGPVWKELMFISGYPNFIVGSGPRLLRSGFQWKISLLYLDQVEEAVVLALDSHGAGRVCYWQGRVIWSECFYNTHTGQIQQGSSPSGAHRRFCWNPLIPPTKGKGEMRRNRGVDGRNVISSSILFTPLEA